jgi:hypothetical protein
MPISQRGSVHEVISEYGYTKTLQIMLDMWLADKMDYTRLEYFYRTLSLHYTKRYNRKIKISMKQLVSRETIGELQ